MWFMYQQADSSIMYGSAQISEAIMKMSRAGIEKSFQAGMHTFLSTQNCYYHDQNDSLISS